MSRRSLSQRSLSRSVSMIAVVCAMAGLLAVAEPSWGEEKLTAEEKIEKKLEQPMEFEFEETSLQEVVACLKKLHGMEIVLDKRALGDEGLDPETPITFGIKNVKLRSALNFVLHPLDLTYTVQDEVLEITTATAAQERLVTRVYTVTELAGESLEKLDALVDAITNCIVPESWSDVGGEGSINFLVLNDQSVLVISQAYETHHEIAVLLDKLRAVIGKPASTDKPSAINSTPACKPT